MPNPTNINNEQKLVRDDLVLPELSYQVVGALFEASNELGANYHERYYYPAVKRALEKRGLIVKSQLSTTLKFQGISLGKYIIDFLIQDQIVLELKVGTRFKRADFSQIKAYLQATKKPLGILARIDTDGVTFHRVLP